MKELSFEKMEEVQGGKWGFCVISDNGETAWFRNSVLGIAVMGAYMGLLSDFGVGNYVISNCSSGVTIQITKTI